MKKRSSIHSGAMQKASSMRIGPGPEITTLPNGVRIVSEYIPDVLSFSLGIWIASGSRDEEKGKEGAYHFLEHLAFRRTEYRSTKALADAFEQMGAYSNAFTTKEHTCFYVRALSKDFAKVYSLMAELTLSPALDSRDIEKERNIIIEEINSCEDEPEEVIFEAGEQLLFGSHTLGHPITGTIDTISSMERSDLVKARAEMYRPDRIVIAVAGNIPHELIVEYAANTFTMPKSSKSKVIRRKPRIQKVKQEIQARTFQQGHVLLGRMTTGLFSEERYRLLLLNIILGEGMSSRLYQSIREKHGLGYTVYSSLDLFTDSGTLYMYTACDNSNIERARDTILNECNRMMHSAPVGKKELERAKAQVKASIIMSLESMSARMQAIGRGLLEEGKIESVEETISKIDAVTEQEIAGIIDNYCETDGWSTVLLESQHA
jgi:predicted Zn-dependent peptidase